MSFTSHNSAHTTAESFTQRIAEDPTSCVMSMTEAPSSTTSVPAGLGAAIFRNTCNTIISPLTTESSSMDYVHDGKGGAATSSATYDTITYTSTMEVPSYKPSKYLHEYSAEFNAAYQPDKERELGYIHVDAQSRFAAHCREFKRASRLVNGIQTGKQLLSRSVRALPCLEEL